MKILPDENIDVNFKSEFEEFDVKTVRDNGWNGIENGELLKLTVDNNCNILVTLDSNIKFQQNISDLKINLIILKAKDSRLSHLKSFKPKIIKLLQQIESLKSFQVYEVSL